jgi:hypothetical protein
VPAFNYTGGDISHLTPGGAASMTDLQGPFTDVRTALNGGLDEVNVPNLSAAFTTWRTIIWGGAAIPTQGAGATLMMPYGTGFGNAAATSAPGGAAYTFYLNPADWLANARTTKLRVRGEFKTNAVAPATSFTGGLYPVVSFGGTSGTSVQIASMGAVVTGSTVSFTTPAANSGLQTLSTEFNAPAAGFYVFAFVVGGGMAAGSLPHINMHLQMRQV